ncbi:hypothetical protein [Leptolyngbya sp. GGD]|uniref:hypothetical protein n=1 Tax=Leptolyngbya sp. GGD TaxID=2997907 RepID=UPI00227A0906|nr:hypothetical protein [Leptolyngbya sp. GGD]MCY6493416.1 hypothetical protein [Leptolyngbya sp. GGD]
MDNNPSILSHVSIGTNDFARAIAFYDAVLQTLGCKRLMEHSGAVAYGKQYPEFWVGPPFDGREHPKCAKVLGSEGLIEISTTKF